MTEVKHAKTLKYPTVKGHENPEMVLRTLFNRIVLECGITGARWSRLLDAFVRKQEMLRGRKVVNIVEAKATANKTFNGSDPMTLKSFIKALQFTRATDVEFRVTIKHPSGYTTSHGVSFTPSGDLLFDEELDYVPAIPATIDIGPIGAQDDNHQRPTPPDLDQWSQRYGDQQSGEGGNGRSST